MCFLKFFFTIYLQLRFVICILYNKWMNEWMNELLTDTKHRAVSLWQQGYLFSMTFNDPDPWFQGHATPLFDAEYYISKPIDVVIMEY